MKALLRNDDRDTRRESFLLLGKLSPRQRLAFVNACARKCADQRVAPRAVSLNGGYTAHEAWMDCWAMCAQWGLSPDWMLPALERAARKFGSDRPEVSVFRPPFSAPGLTARPTRRQGEILLG